MPDTASAFDRRPARQSHRPRRASARAATPRCWIKDGRVAVNGKVIRTPAFNVTDKDKIKVDGAAAGRPPGHARLALSQARGPRGHREGPRRPRRPSSRRSKQQGLPRVVSIGRLDINTEGLLLLTNDGGLKRVLELPATGWLRRYRVRAFGTITQAAARCAQGRHRDRRHQIRPDRSHARARAGQQCLAGAGAARRQEPRGQERARRARPRRSTA